jgi:hypothetical protein
VRPRQTCPHCGEDVEQLTYCGNCGRPLAAATDAAAVAEPVTDPAAEPDVADPTAEASVPTPAPEASAPSPTPRVVVEPAPGESARPAPAGLLGTKGIRLRGRRPTVAGVRLLVVVVAAALAVVALLADEAGLALVVAAVAAPLLLVDALVRRDVFDRMPPLALLGVAAAGVVAGGIVGGIAVVLTDELWLDDHALDVASLGLGARAAEGDGSPPILVLALAGLLLPAAGAALSLAVPLYLRRWPTYRNEVMDGVILGAAAGGGYAIGTAIANLWPILTGDSLGGDVPEWTVATVGVVLLRPMILVATTALIGAGIWKYDLTGRSRDLLVPLAAGLGWTVVYAFVSLFAGAWGPTIGLVWSLGVLVAVAAIARSILNEAIGHDRRWLAAGHVVCPHCRSVTPAGKFCSACRGPLPQGATPAAAAS